jgi:hypothetical protein
MPHAPARPEEVVFRQRADRLEIRARTSLTGVREEGLQPPVRPVLLAFVAQTESMAEGWDRSTRDREFLRSARAFPLEPVPTERLGQRVRLRRNVPVATFPQSEALVLALAIEDARGRSIPSPRKVFVPADPPLSPLDSVSIEVLEDRIELSWRPPQDERVRTVRIYRTLGAEPYALLPWREVELQRGRVVDEEARYGQTLRYRLTAASRGKDVAIESAPTTPGPVDYDDVFAPDPVVDLEAVPGSGVIRVLWFPGGSPDEVAALVERQAGGETGFDEVGRVSVPDADFTDTEVRPGQRYRYRVKALDAQGNASAPAGPTEWVRPRPPEREP